MATIDLGKTEETFEGAYDVAIKKYIHGKEGGVVLDATDFPDDYINRGHGVILENDVYKPQPVDGSKEEFLVGVVVSNTLTSKPSVGVMTIGVINNNAVKYAFNATALTKLATLGIQNQVD